MDVDKLIWTISGWGTQILIMVNVDYNHMVDFPNTFLCLSLVGEYIGRYNYNWGYIYLAREGKRNMFRGVRGKCIKLFIPDFPIPLPNSSL